MGSILSTLSRLGSFLSDCCTLSSNEDRSNPLEPETHQPSPSVASSSSDGCNYDVFLSFRGIDTRKTFTGHLYAALDRAGIRTFLDDNELERGEAIGPKLFEAIEGSKIWIPIFSSNYASSVWCLEELAKMIECRDRQKLLPIFYDVDPSHVRNQTGSFTKAFHGHQKCFEKEKVETWRHALREAGSASGWDLKEATHGDGKEMKSGDIRYVYHHDIHSSALRGTLLQLSPLSALRGKGTCVRRLSLVLTDLGWFLSFNPRVERWGEEMSMHDTSFKWKTFGWVEKLW